MTPLLPPGVVVVLVVAAVWSVALLVGIVRLELRCRREVIAAVARRHRTVRIALSGADPDRSESPEEAT